MGQKYKYINRKKGKIKISANQNRTLSGNAIKYGYCNSPTKSNKNSIIKSQIYPLQKSLQNTANHKIHTIIIQIQQQNYELHALVFNVRSVQLWLLL